MPKRWVRLEIDENLTRDQYADLAHAIWATAKVALPDGGFTLKHDGVNSNAQLNKRWVDLGKDIPWR